MERNRAFCFACRHFTTGGAKSETSCTKDGFGDWKHALGKNGILQGHSKCLTHTEAMSTWLQFKGNKEKSTLIENHMSKEQKSKFLVIDIMFLVLQRQFFCVRIWKYHYEATMNLITQSTRVILLRF